MSISTPNAISTPSTSPTITTDALIIGFGKGGKTLAAKLSAAGRKVVVAEASADMYGGTCINIGCLPSKSLILSAEQARRDGANSTPETREAAFEAAIKEKRRVTSMLRDKNYHKLADQDNITGTSLEREAFLVFSIVLSIIISYISTVIIFLSY